MAKINSDGSLAGGIGPVSFRKLRGQKVVQSKCGKGKMKQTVPTKSSASEFGIANTVGKMIRLRLEPIHQNFTDAYVANRFANALHKVALSNTVLPKGNRSFVDGDLSLLSQFQFNPQSPTEDYFAVTPVVQLMASREFALSISEFSIREQVVFPEYAVNGEWVCYVVAFDPVNWMPSQQEWFRLPMANTDGVVPAQEWSSAALPTGHVAFVTAAFIAYKTSTLLGTVAVNQKEWHPCAVLGVYRV